MRDPRIKQSESLWMMQAIQLAEKGRGYVEPNPLVGAVVLDRKGRKIAEGCHQKFGGPHAEVEALRRAGKKARGGTLFVTLEPCSTHGKTPPCTDLIIKSGIKRVVVGCVDPNPKHQGRGLHYLGRKGIEVHPGVLEAVIQKQNSRFFKFMKSDLPYVTLKLAQSIDGKIATSQGESKWITSKESRGKVQALRACHEAILVGTNTLRTDEPSLRLRNRFGRQPRRVFIVRHPASQKKYLISRDCEGDILFFHSDFNFQLKEMKQVRAPFSKEGISIPFLMRQLVKEGISSLLVEGGGEIAASFLEGNWVDQVYFFMAPIIIGGREAKTGVEGQGFKNLHHALRITDPKVERLGEDVLVSGEIDK